MCSCTASKYAHHSWLAALAELPHAMIAYYTAAMAAVRSPALVVVGRVAEPQHPSVSLAPPSLLIKVGHTQGEYECAVRPALVSSCIWGEGERKGDWRGSNVRDCEGEGEGWYRVGVRGERGCRRQGLQRCAHLDGRRRRRSAALTRVSDPDLERLRS